jgi:glyoxylase-like metal-dependent hydrolase (beta-lactamase superfamily II)
MKIFPIHISNFKVDGGAMFGVIPKMLWNNKYPADENNMIKMSLRSVLIDNGENVVLVDNGYGDKQSEKYFRYTYQSGGDGLINGINKAGYEPEDITDVVLTHLHSDHCGGGVRKNHSGTAYELTFPNASYWVSQRQWDWAINPNIREASAYPEDNLLPMMDSGHLRFADEEGELFKGISVRIVDGHTPGQIIPVIEYKGTKVIFAADLIPTVAHIPLLWNMSYDIDQLKTIEEKESILRESIDNGYIIFFEHDLETECCTLRDTSRGIMEDHLFKLSDL